MAPSDNVTVQAARKWLLGLSIPTQTKLRVLADWLSVTLEWLRFGEEVDAEAVSRSGIESAQTQMMVDFHNLSASDAGIVRVLIDILVDRPRRRRSPTDAPLKEALY